MVWLRSLIASVVPAGVLGAAADFRRKTSQMPAVTDNALSVPYGQITFDAEGSERKGVWFSRVLHWPGGQSGVTIGRGYDIGFRSPAEIRIDCQSAGMKKEQIELLVEGARIRGVEAEKLVLLNTHAFGEITPEQQKQLFIISYQEYRDLVVRISKKDDVVRKFGAVSFEHLHPTILDVAVDLAYRGDYSSISRNWFQPVMVANSINLLQKCMQDIKWRSVLGVPINRYEVRKQFAITAAKDEEYA